MRGADDSSSQEEVLDIAAVITTEGNLIDSLADQMFAAGNPGIDPLRRMQIAAPASVRYGILMNKASDDVLLREHVRTFETAAFPLARYLPHPLKRQISGFREFSRVLNVIPHSVNNAPKLPLDFFAFMNGIEPATPFHPPEMASIFAGFYLFVPWKQLFDVAEGKTWSNIPDRMAGVLAVKVDRVA